jgi:hypothetical protein
MKDYHYEISEEQDRYKVRAHLVADGRGGEEHDVLVESLLKHKIFKGDDEEFRYEISRDKSGALQVFAVFGVNKTELKYEFEHVKEDMDEVAERAQGRYWDALEYAERFIAMLQVAKELSLL